MTKKLFFYLTLIFIAAFFLLSPVSAEKRTALVIGNAEYSSSPLVNPVNDAADIASALSDLGFEVILEKNADKRTMLNAMDQFGKKLLTSSVGIFYFAGHGMQIHGRNYLIPVQTRIISDSDVEFEAVDAGRVLGKMGEAENSLNIIILDACRDNPFKRSFRSSKKGLAQINAPPGSIMAYATSPGSLSFDGDERNGIYTKYLLENIKMPGLTVQEVFMETGLSVMKKTNKKQIPWMSSTPIPRYYLAGTGSTPPGNIKVEQERPAGEQKDLAPASAVVKNDSLLILAKEQKKLAMEKNQIEIINRLEAERKKIEEEKQKLLAMAKLRPKPVTRKNKKITNSLGMEFVYIKPGILTRGFYMQTTEVTRGQWKMLMGNNPLKFKKGDDYPVEQVSWKDVRKFIKKLNRKEGSGKYRLPTEAEWEYARWAGSYSLFALNRRSEDRGGRLSRDLSYLGFRLSMTP